jgi:hypothetical protein
VVRSQLAGGVGERAVELAFRQAEGEGDDRQQPPGHRHDGGHVLPGPETAGFGC